MVAGDNQKKKNGWPISGAVDTILGHIGNQFIALRFSVALSERGLS
jgi:hypothetical protein